MEDKTLLDTIMELSKRIGVLERDNEILKAENEELKKQIKDNSNTTSSYDRFNPDNFVFDNKKKMSGQERLDESLNKYRGESESPKKTKKILKRDLF